jgi:hypothetical protein
MPRLLTLAAVAILFSGGGVQTAHASYIVDTSAQTNISGAIIARADYNLNGTGGTFFTTTSGNSPASATSSGTIDSTGALTASTDQAFVSYTTSGTQAGTVFSTADLVSGTLRASNVNVSLSGVSSHTFAEFSDVLHYTIANATSLTTTDITVQFALDGTFSAGTSATGIVTWNMGFGTAHLDTLIDNDTVTCAGTSPNPCIYVQTEPGWVSTSFSSNTPGNIVFSGVYAITGATADIPVSAYLEIANGGGASSSFDYSHTAQFILPTATGVSYTSDSTVFLTAGAGASAPEPASIVLIGLGLVTIGFARRRLHP